MCWGGNIYLFYIYRFTATFRKRRRLSRGCGVYPSLMHPELAGVCTEIRENMFFGCGKNRLGPQAQMAQERLQPEVIQLRLHIVHKEDRVETAGCPVNFHLSEVERQQAAALLSGRTEIRQGFSVQQENHVVPVRTDRSESPSLVYLPRLTNSLPELFLRLARILALQDCGGLVMDLDIFPLAERVAKFALDIVHMKPSVPQDAASFLHQFFFPAFQKGEVYPFLSGCRRCEKPVPLLQSPTVSGKAPHVSWADGEHGTIEECTPLTRPSSHHFQMLLAKGQDVEISDEFSQESRFPVQEEPLIVPSKQGNAKFSCQSSVCDNAIHPAFLLPMLNAFFRYRGSKTASVAEEVDSFEEVGLSLPVLTEEEICARTKIDLLQIEIPVLIKAETDYLHT